MQEYQDNMKKQTLIFKNIYVKSTYNFDKKVVLNGTFLRFVFDH